MYRYFIPFINEYHSIVWAYGVLCINSSVDGHWVVLPFFIVNNAAMNI